MYPCLSCGGWSAYLRMVPRLSRMLSDSPMPGVKTVNGMIGISARPVGRNVFGQPQQGMEQRPESVGADRGKRGVDGGDGLLDDGVGLFVQLVANLVGVVLQPMLALVYPLVGFVVAGVGMPRKVDSSIWIRPRQAFQDVMSVDWTPRKSVLDFSTATCFQFRHLSLPPFLPTVRCARPA